MRPTRQRGLPGAVALFGVALVVPSIWAPTWRETTFATDRGEPIREQLRWSWGRVEDLGADGGRLQDVGNQLGVVVLVAVLLLAVTAATGWVIARGAWAGLGAPVALGLVAGRVLGSVVDRTGRGVQLPIPGLVSVSGSTVVGVLESLGGLTLLASVVLMMSEVVRSGTRSGRLPRMPALVRPDRERGAGRIAEVPPRPGSQPAVGDLERRDTGQSGLLSAPEVGFSDDDER